MPIFQLPEEPIFPPVHLADPDGVLAVGGDLSPKRLLTAYSMGIFPWFNPDQIPIWWSPDPRCVIFPAEAHISKSMRKTLNQKRYEIKFDRHFHDVMVKCGEPRPKQDGTWISEDFLEAYTILHAMGYAHSVEAWQGDELVGGLYGVSLGRWFFGESMFAHAKDASKAAFLTLCKKMIERDFVCVDCQIVNPHLESLGARMIPRDDFVSMLDENWSVPTIKTPWHDWEDDSASS